jgi:polyether ionophore transport system permease protein
MSGVAGAWVVLRFTARREWVRITVWIASIVAVVGLTAASIKTLFPTQAALDQAAAASAKNAAAIAFNGPVQGLDTVGGEVAFQAGTIGLILVALMSLLLTARYTRAEEESGRTELLRATVLGRHAQTAAALVLVTAMNGVVAVTTALLLIGQGLPTAGSVTFGLSFLAIGIVFTALALVTAQINESSRTASGLAGAVLGVAFILRAVGDIGDGRLSWLSPIGWSQKPRPFAGERWWPFLVPATITVALLLVAAILTTRRDYGAGLVQPRPGRAAASAAFGSAFGLAARLQRSTVVWWAVGLFVLGFVYGSIATDIEDFVGDNETLKQLMAAAGGASITDAYFGTAMLTCALIAAGFAVQSALRARTEETTLHAEYVLATRASRYRWLASHLTIAAAGSLAVLSAAGLGAGIPYAVQVSDPSQISRLLGAALAYLPAVWLLVGVVGALFGLAPRAAAATWALVGGYFVVGFLGDVLGLPRWVMNLSPFEQTPQLPAKPLTLTPLAVMLAISAALTAMGFLRFRRRDIG